MMRCVDMMNTGGKGKEVCCQLQKPGCSSLYMFASLNFVVGGYVLYKIDYKHLDNNIELVLSSDKDKVKSTPLTPFLIFYRGDLPEHFCSLVPMGEYLYFVGEEASDVFKIAKSEIKDLLPDEHNLGLNYLKRLEPPMNSPKCEPLVFAVKGNLYVISGNHTSSVSYTFEMYSPSNNCWTVLKYTPSKFRSHFKSHVVLDDTVYFATSDLYCCAHDGSIYSYNVTHHSWKEVFITSRDDGLDLHPAFEPPLVPIGNRLFGGFSLPYRDINASVAASSYTKLNDSDRHAESMFMRPTLAPDPNFWHDFFLRDKYVAPWFGPSYYITDLCTLEGQNVLCCVSYGCHPTSDDTVAFFNFFKIPGDIWTTTVTLGEEPKDESDFCYYARQVDSDSKFAAKSYFKSEFMHRKLFNISTQELLVQPGKLITCFSC